MWLELLPLSGPGSLIAEVQGRRPGASTTPEDLAGLYSGEAARNRPAGPETLPQLQRWDSFYLLVVTADEEADLDAQWGDSYLGDWT